MFDLFKGKKEDIVEPVKETPKKEDPVMVAKLEDSSRRKKLAEKEMAVMDVRCERRGKFKLEREKLDLRKALLLSKKEHYLSEIRNIELQLRLIENDVLEQKRIELKDAKSHKTFVKELKSRLDIKSDKWGFNPESGEIIE